MSPSLKLHNQYCHTGYFSMDEWIGKKSVLVPDTVDSGNSKRLNSEQSLISKHFLVQTPIVL